MKKQLAIIGLAALVVAGCGPSKAELEEQERQRQEAEQAAEREAKRRELDEELAQISRQIE